MIKSKKIKNTEPTFLKGNSGITYQVSNGSKVIIRYQRPEATEKGSYITDKCSTSTKWKPSVSVSTKLGISL